MRSAVASPPGRRGNCHGDFKLDQLPFCCVIFLGNWTLGLTDLGGFAAGGSEASNLLMSDSPTPCPGIVPTSATSAPVLNEIFADTQGSGHCRLLRQPLTASSRCSTAAAATAARWPASAVPWAHMGWPGTGYLGCRRPRRPAVSTRATRGHASRRGVLVCTAPQGRADVCAVPDCRPGPPDQDRRGRHGHPGLLADTRAMSRRGTG